MRWSKPIKLHKNQKKSIKQRLPEMTKFSIDESDSAANSTKDDIVVETSKGKYSTIKQPWRGMGKR